MRSWPDDPSKMSLDRPHKGPCAFYLKKVSSAVDDKATGDGWFKLYDQGYDKSTDRWCTDDLIDNKGRFSVKIPENLAGGYYLARPELLALHNATDGDGQFYLGCGQIYVESKGDLAPEQGSTVSIPGYVKAGDPSVKFNIYNKKNDQYKVPGPAVAKLVSGGNAGKASDGAAKQSEGLKPASCILENGNWCGKEVAAYSDEKGCWASGEDCWAQAKTCWDAAGPTGGKGCKIWQEKCEAMNNGCKSKNFNGPPNKDKDLTPEKATIDVGKVMGSKLEVVNGNAAAAPAAPAAPSAAPSAAPASSEKKAEATSVAAEAKQPKASETPAQAEQPKPSASSNEKPSTKSRSRSRPTVTPAPVANIETEVVKVYQTVTVNPYERRRRGVHHRRAGVL